MIDFKTFKKFLKSYLAFALRMSKISLTVKDGRKFYILKFVKNLKFKLIKFYAHKSAARIFVTAEWATDDGEK